MNADRGEQSKCNFKGGNNGGHVVQCSCTGHQNNWESITFAHVTFWILMTTRLRPFFFFNNSAHITIGAIHYSPDAMKCSAVIGEVLSADWSNNIWNAFFFSLSLSYPLFSSSFPLPPPCVFFVVTQGQRGVYPPISAASLDERSAHSRWHHSAVCSQHAATPFISCKLKFTTSSPERRSQHV